MPIKIILNLILLLGLPMISKADFDFSLRAEKTYLVARYKSTYTRRKRRTQTPDPAPTDPTPTDPTPTPMVQAETLLANATPVVGAEISDTNAVELGMLFQSNVGGEVLGVQFYREVESSQSYTVKLWDAQSGALMASQSVAAQANASAGYRQGIFAQPIVILAGHQYVVSYHSQTGQYGYTSNGFASAISNGSLTAPQNAGVYAYGSGSSMPDQSYQASNYYVDVLFKASSVQTTPDPTPTPEPTPDPTPTPNPTPIMNADHLPGPSESLHKNHPYYTCQVNRYVATAANGGSDSNDGTSLENKGNGVGPWLTLNKANSSLPANASGYCVNIGDGSYSTNLFQINKGGKSAAMNGFVVYRSVNLLGAKLVAASGANGLVQITTPYVIVDGLELDGRRLASVDHGIDTCFNGPSYNGIHHITVLNSYIHDLGGNGVGTCWAEYYWMIHNRSDNNAYNSWNSGISTYQSIAIPGYVATAYDKQWTPYHNVYAYNRFDGNFTSPAGGPHTDGNGLIYDDSQHQQSSPNVVYPHMALIMGNLSTNNGGAGIQIGPTSSNADIVNNTAYNNYRDTYNTGTWRGEISGAFNQNVSFANNIGVAKPGSGILQNNSPFLGGNPVDGSNSWESNIAFGAGVYMNAPNTFASTDGNRNVDPRLVNLSGGDFALCQSVGVPAASCSGKSPAIGSGIQVPYWHQQTMGAIDIGACPADVETCR